MQDIHCQGFYPSAEMQLVYFTAPADRAHDESDYVNSFIMNLMINQFIFF